MPMAHREDYRVIKMQTLPNIVDEANRLMEMAQHERLNIRLIGGLAVKLHSPSMESFNFRREYPDIDFVAYHSDAPRLTRFFSQMGYQADKAFNNLNGRRRQIYHDPFNGRHIDIFVGDFEMCHRLPLRDRLGLHPTTVPLAELFLSKAQIVELNRKDALDLISLLLDNEVGGEDIGQINLDRIAWLCARDWGLYTTTAINLNRLEVILREENLGLDADQTSRALERIGAIRNRLATAGKPFLWKARNRVGTRLRWYTEVEEVDRDNG